MSKMIYLASPYSHPDKKVMEENYLQVSKLAAKLCSEGHIVFAPITYGHTLCGFEDMPTDWEFWANFCITFLSKCDEMIIYKMEGYDRSIGVAKEVEYCLNNGIPFDYKEL